MDKEVDKEALHATLNLLLESTNVCGDFTMLAKCGQPLLGLDSEKRTEEGREWTRLVVCQSISVGPLENMSSFRYLMSPCIESSLDEEKKTFILKERKI
jgi:hypothetical protein